MNAIEFINTTKLENLPTTERIEPELSETDKRSIRSRKTLRWAIIGLAIVAVVLFLYVVYQIYLLL